MPRKARAKKRLQPPQARATPKPPSRRRRRKRTPSTVSPFRRCVLGGPSTNHPSFGFPDGDPNPAITLDLKTTYILKPSATGDLSFAVAPNSNGAFVVLVGKLSSSTSAFAGYSAASVNGMTSSTLAAGVDLAGAIPDTRLNSWWLGWGDDVARTFSAFRVIVAVADVAFTGSSMYNQGTVTVAKVPGLFPQRGDSPLTYSTSKTIQLPMVESRHLEDTSVSSQGANVVVLPAKSAFRTRVLGAKSDYNLVKPTLYFDGLDNKPSFAFVSPIPTTGILPGPTYAENCPVKVVTYTGLDASATVSVVLRYCVQVEVAIGNTTTGAMAGASPTANPSELSWYSRVASAMPTVESLTNAARGAARVARLFAQPYPNIPLALRDDL